MGHCLDSSRRRAELNEAFFDLALDFISNLTFELAQFVHETLVPGFLLVVELVKVDHPLRLVNM